MNQTLLPMLISLITTLVTSCTIHIIDDTNDYDIEAVVTTPDCDIHIIRSETRRQKKAKVE